MDLASLVVLTLVLIEERHNSGSCPFDEKVPRRLPGHRPIVASL